MFHYLASVRFLSGNTTKSPKAYTYLVSYSIAQKILTALQYSARSAFKIRTSMGDTYRDANVVFETFAPCADYTQARNSYKEIVQITPVVHATAPYCFNIADANLKRLLDDDLNRYGAYVVKDNPAPVSHFTTKANTTSVPLSPKSSNSGSIGLKGTPGIPGIATGGMWQLFEETQERETKKNSDWPEVTAKLGKALEDLCGPAVTSTAPIFTMTVPDNGNPTISINPNQKEKSTMFDNIMKDMYFGPYKNKDVRLSMQGMAVKTPEGRYNVYNAQTGALTDVTGFLMDDFGDVFYAIPVAQKDIKVGDVILHNKAPVIVTQIGATMISVLDPSRGEEVKKVPAKSFFGFDFYSKIINAMEGLMGTANADQPFGMLPMLMLMNDNGGESDSMMKMVMMAQMMGGATNGQMNPMLMIALMGDKGGDNSMMKYFMMTEMMKQGGNGFGGLFSAPVATPVAPTAKAPDVKTSKTNEPFSQDRV